jgi:hypothetical protein
MASPTAEVDVLHFLPNPNSKIGFAQFVLLGEAAALSLCSITTKGKSLHAHCLLILFYNNYSFLTKPFRVQIVMDKFCCLSLNKLSKSILPALELLKYGFQYYCH